MENTKYKHRFIARIVLEAETALKVGSGNKEIHTDATVARDVNGLPYIPGTSIAGVIRHALEDGKKKLNDFFGFQEKQKGHGSEIIFTDAKMIGADGKAVDGLQIIDFEQGDFYPHFKSLPVRQHVRINSKGVAERGGKFDEEVVYKGTRFCFEIEVVAAENCDAMIKEVLSTLRTSELRIGGGSRKGFGKMKVVSCDTKTLDLTTPADLQWYLNHSSNLSEPFDENAFTFKPKQTAAATYHLTLHPEDFFLFGAGFGDDEADLVPVKEKVVVWNGHIPSVEQDQILIPASSIKGALAHRTAYHYNRIHRYFAGSKNAKVGNENEAVKALFGYTTQDGRENARGNLLFEDIIEALPKDKIFNHVSIDRFTGGAIDGALFQEKATYGKGQTYETTIVLLKDDFEDKEAIVKAFEEALKDMCTGMLPLGGGVNKGYGCFTGKIMKNGKEL